MPPAIRLLRLPYRAVVTRFNCWPTFFLLCMLAIPTADRSLYGQKLEFRLVDPAGHMDLWPDAEPEIRIVPTDDTLFTPQRVAARLQTQDSEPREEGAIKKLPEPALEQTDSEDIKQQIERLEIPPASTPQPEALPDSSQRDCYQAPPLSATSASIALPEGKLPTNIAAICGRQHPPTGDTRLVGGWAGTEFHWSATCMRHRPLYFEEINAERYGYTISYCLQPVISAARFFGTIPALPYKMVIERPRDCIYELGHYRPGSCAPRRWHRLPLDFTAAVVETGFIAGMILIIP